MVGGIETLNEMEKIEVDNKDRPIEDIVLVKAQIFVDPYQEADEQVIKNNLIALDHCFSFLQIISWQKKERKN